MDGGPIDQRTIDYRSTRDPLFLYGIAPYYLKGDQRTMTITIDQRTLYVEQGGEGGSLYIGARPTYLFSRLTTTGWPALPIYAMQMDGRLALLSIRGRSDLVVSSPTPLPYMLVY